MVAAPPVGQVYRVVVRLARSPPCSAWYSRASCSLGHSVTWPLPSMTPHSTWMVSPVCISVMLLGVVWPPAKNNLNRLELPSGPGTLEDMPAGTVQVRLVPGMPCCLEGALAGGARDRGTVGHPSRLLPLVIVHLHLALLLPVPHPVRAVCRRPPSRTGRLCPDLRERRRERNTAGPPG